MARVPEFLDDLDIISKLGNNPGPDDGLEPDPLKSKFDEAGNKIKVFINKYIIPALNNYVAGTDGLLNLTGGTMKGDINLDGKHRITRMADPVSAQDGTPKSYVDKILKDAKEYSDSAAALAVSRAKEEEHPVGSWWFCDDMTSPAEKFGGVWEKLTDRCLVGAGGFYPIGHTGGEVQHTLTESELPVLTGTISPHSGHSAWNSATGVFETSEIGNGYRVGNVEYEYDSVTLLKFKAGGNRPHNNMQPYYATMIWRRIA